MHSKFLIAFLLFAPCTLTFAQESAFGFLIGVANYQGDLSEQQITLVETKPCLGVFVRRQLRPQLAMRGNLTGSTIAGSDFNYAERVHRGLTFSSPVIEGGLTFEWDILGKWRQLRRAYRKTAFTPFVSSGFGLTYFNPKVKGFDMTNDANVRDDEKSKITFNVMIPIGAGIKYDVNERYTIGLEFASHLPFTDYLDGVSVSGEPGNHDWYIFGGVTVQYWVRNEKAFRRGKKI